MTYYKTYRYCNWYGSTGWIAAACEVEKESRKVKIAYAFCSPSEKKFNKKLARIIADGRLMHEKSRVELVLPDKQGLSKTLNEVVFKEGLVAYIRKRGAAGDTSVAHKGQVPKWVAQTVEDLDWLEHCSSLNTMGDI